MKKIIAFLIVACAACQLLQAQELYVFSEPASNMPTGSVSGKLTWRVPAGNQHTGFHQRYIPELMFGLSRQWMVHVTTTFSDFYTPQLRWESARAYGKYRFYSDDDVHRHFRMAVFGEAAWTRSPFYYGDINLDGDNSGVQAGVIATELVNKLAISGTASAIRVFAGSQEPAVKQGQSQTAMYYSLSTGYLLFPVNYTGYNQTNLNLYVEMIGMKGLDKGGYMVDLAPALQLIFNSNLKLNLGARMQLGGDMQRIGERNYFVSLERTFLGALKKHGPPR